MFRQVLKLSIISLSAICIFIFVTGKLSLAATITTVTVLEKDGITTENYPLTFGHIFKKGDVLSSIKVFLDDIPLPTQFDVKRHWADGSVKHGVVSVIIPQLPANGVVTLVLETNDDSNNTGAMDKTSILATNVESQINLSNISGSGNPSDASASLRNEIANSTSLDYWLQGPVCTEILEDCSITPNDNLHARWEARFYPSTSFGIRISTTVESVNLCALGNSTYSLSLKYGISSPIEVYRYTDYSHPYGSRWRKIFWLGPKPPEIEIHYNTAYLISTGMIPPLDTSVTVPDEYIDKLYDIYKTRNGEIRGGDDIDGAGNFYRAMPMVGGRDELGIIPTWQAVYLLTYSNKAREMVLGNGNIAGQIASLHYSEGDPGKDFFSKPAISIDSRPHVKLYDLQRDVPTPLGEIPNNPNSWNPDRNHQPAAIYLPYIITGEYFYAEELSYWASYDLGYSYWARNGRGDSYDFSSHFSGYDAGIIHDETRGVAWSMRNIADAVVILPESMNSLASYFREKLNNTFKWLELANTPEHSGIHFIIVSRKLGLGGWEHTDAPWQHDFNIIVLNDIIRKQEAVNDLDALTNLRDFLGYFTVGRFTNDPDFSKWDGALYYAPVAQKDGNPLESNWKSYYDLCKAYWLDDPHHSGGAPHTSAFDSSWVNDPESYLYIAKAALSGLTHLANGQRAYELVNENINFGLVYQKPQWGGLIPGYGSGYTYQVKPSILSISIE